MQPIECLSPSKHELHKPANHGPIVPAISSAMACASGLAFLAEGTGPHMIIISSVVGAALGFYVRYFKRGRE